MSLDFDVFVVVDPIAVAGDSAGGGLAVALLVATRDAGQANLLTQGLPPIRLTISS
jgi:acetyl esterase/lipase